MTKQQALIKTEAFVRKVLERDLKQRTSAKVVHEVAQKILKEIPIQDFSKASRERAVA